jgi:glycosidase
MQWDSSANAGFSSGTPWLPVPPSAREKNVAAQASDPGSLLNFYKRLIALRRASPALLDGDFEAVGADPNVFAYLRRGPRQTMFVALNMSAEARTFPARPGARLRLSSRPRDPRPAAGDAIELAPFEAVVYELPAR